MQSVVLSRESISSVYAIVIPVRPLFSTSSSVQLAGIRSDTIIGTSLRRAARAVFGYNKHLLRQKTGGTCLYFPRMVTGLPVLKLYPPLTS